MNALAAAQHPATTPLEMLGGQLRARRKALKVSAVAAAEAAGMSRVTLHRIERGEPSVTMGAYVQAAAVLNLQIGVVPSDTAQSAPAATLEGGWIPLHIPLDGYPQLQRLAWQIDARETLTPREALDIYERNARHLDETALTPRERLLMASLREALGSDGRRI